MKLIFKTLILSFVVHMHSYVYIFLYKLYLPYFSRGADLLERREYQEGGIDL